MTKKCSRCGKTKPKSDFVKNSRNRDRLSSWCKECTNEQRRERYRIRDRAWKDDQNRKKREWSAALPVALKRKQHLRKRYGLTPEQHEAMYVAQNGRCALCKEPLPYDSPDLHTDHDHKTGKVRGLLCRECNYLIGKIENHLDLMYDAFEYIGL